MVIFQIYKVLDFSSKLREKYVCDPNDAMRYLIASKFFYNGTNPAKKSGLRKNTRDGFDFSNFFDFGVTNPPDEMMTTMIMTGDESTMIPTTELIIDTGFSSITLPPILERPPFTADEQASYNLATLICKLPKRKLITDAEFLTKQIDYAALNNYVTTQLIS